MSRTTKGPWTTDGVYSERDGCWWVYGADCTPVAQVPSFGGDACLVAAAPEMLAALEAADRILWMAEEFAAAGGSRGQERRDYDKAAAEISAAIAKAKGAKP